MAAHCGLRSLTTLVCLIVGAGGLAASPQGVPDLEGLVDGLFRCSRRAAEARQQFLSGKVPFEDAVAVNRLLLESGYPSVAEDCSRARARLLELDREAIRLVIARLGALDLATFDGAVAGEFLTSWLREVFSGGYPWMQGTTAGALEANRNAAHAWTALWERVKDDASFWRLPGPERSALCASIDGSFVAAETVMLPGMRISATTEEGKIEIRAEAGFGRSYTWDGSTRFAVLEPRHERWHGSLGIYCPGTGDHWEEHRGVTRGVLEEGLQHFDTTEDALAWLRERSYMDFVHRSDGLVVGWGRELSRRQLSVEVWQIYVNGEKPTALPGSKDDTILVE